MNEQQAGLRELVKAEIFAAIEYGRLRPEVTQSALEASWIDHLDYIMEYCEEYIEAQLAEQNLGKGPRRRDRSLPAKKSTELCVIEDCDDPYLARGLCNKHYMRLMHSDQRPDEMRMTYHGRAR